MIYRKDLEVGQSYEGTNGSTRRISYIGKDNVVYTDQEGNEHTWAIDTFMAMSKPLSKEPRRLGRLYMCAKENTDLGDRYIYGDIFVSQDFQAGHNFKPVTMDNEGNIFEVIE